MQNADTDAQTQNMVTWLFLSLELDSRTVQVICHLPLYSGAQRYYSLFCRAQVKCQDPRPDTNSPRPEGFVYAASWLLALACFMEQGKARANICRGYFAWI